MRRQILAPFRGPIVQCNIERSIPALQVPSLLQTLLPHASGMEPSPSDGGVAMAAAIYRCQERDGAG